MNRPTFPFPLRHLIVAMCAALAAALATPSRAAGDDAAQMQTPPGHPPTLKKTTPPPQAQVDINRASRAQLKRLSGIDDAQAEKIIKGRPYLSKADLVTRKVLPEGVYLSIRHQIVAIPLARPKPGK